MANAIELAKSYVPKLDEVYKLAALTSVLDSDGAELKEGANAGEFIIPKMSMDGLGAYDRNNGYAQGSVTMENETVKANFDRGRKFVVDAMYAYAQLDAGNGAVQSVSIGSVSENRAAVPAPDTSPAARAAEYYRCAQLYATIYRGC